MISVWYSVKWYVYEDGIQHKTLFTDSYSDPYRRDADGTLNATGDYEMSICGKVNPIVAAAYYKTDLPFCELCERIRLLEQLGE